MNLIAVVSEPIEESRQLQVQSFAVFRCCLYKSPDRGANQIPYQRQDAQHRNDHQHGGEHIGHTLALQPLNGWGSNRRNEHGHKKWQQQVAGRAEPCDNDDDCGRIKQEITATPLHLDRLHVRTPTLILPKPMLGRNSRRIS